MYSMFYTYAHVLDIMIGRKYGIPTLIRPPLIYKDKRTREIFIKNIFDESSFQINGSHTMLSSIAKIDP